MKNETKKIADFIIDEIHLTYFLALIYEGVKSKTNDLLLLTIFDAVLSEKDTKNLFRSSINTHLNSKLTKEEVEYVMDILDDPVIKKVKEEIMKTDFNTDVFQPFHEYLISRTKEVYDEYTRDTEEG